MSFFMLVVAGFAGTGKLLVMQNLFLSLWSGLSDRAAGFLGLRPDAVVRGLRRKKLAELLARIPGAVLSEEVPARRALEVVIDGERLALKVRPDLLRPSAPFWVETLCTKFVLLAARGKKSGQVSDGVVQPMALGAEGEAVYRQLLGAVTERASKPALGTATRGKAKSSGRATGRSVGNPSPRPAATAPRATVTRTEQIRSGQTRTGEPFPRTSIQGVVQHTVHGTARHNIHRAGGRFDLHDCWIELRARYFPDRPDVDKYKVIWSNRSCSRMLACCDVRRSVVRVAAPMNRQESLPYLPALLYHEMCHAILGKPEVRNGRRVIHGREFKALERRHPGIKALDHWIKKGGWRDAVRASRRGQLGRTKLRTSR